MQGELGLGSFPSVTLADACKRARALRASPAPGEDPVARRLAARSAARIAARIAAQLDPVATVD